MRIFLGGTCAESTWRKNLIKQLFNTIDYFDPVVDDWTPECQAREIKERENCDYCLYTITPKMEGYYSIAEVIDDSNKRPEKTVFVVLSEDEDKTFNSNQLKSFKTISDMVLRNGGVAFDNLDDAAAFFNFKFLLNYNEDNFVETK